MVGYRYFYLNSSREINQKCVSSISLIGHVQTLVVYPDQSLVLKDAVIEVQRMSREDVVVQDCQTVVEYSEICLESFILTSILMTNL